ncbi:leucine-rich repeat domain-containing protein [Chryseobacterium daecheongense]|uniref:leucine-rich repeat domain-containing protein n=1 Tax=Chryseobacterium daecheongense TaxID=192389 RepID=UPI001FD6BEA7|nr:leucine-rich repeat domain-containing protein [Chryseobacterium daecheongense]UOU99156.1 leucine-rich repeat domain-containing protein [Chryseobacterium daecheongense]
MRTKEELRLYFENGDRPTQNHFWEWQDSYWHKDEKILLKSVESIEKIYPLIVNGEYKGSYLSITLPDNIRKIADSAFVYSGFSYQIREVILNEGLEEIGRSAFGSQNIKKIKTPSTLKIIRQSAFAGQANANNYSDSTEEIILNEGLEVIEDYAFASGNSLKSLYLPDSLQSVGLNALAIPSLQTVSAPAGLDLSSAGIPESAIITYR